MNPLSDISMQTRIKKESHKNDKKGIYLVAKMIGTAERL